MGSDILGPCKGAVVPRAEVRYEGRGSEEAAHQGTQTEPKHCRHGADQLCVRR